MEGFREAVEICGFTDLGYIGLPYTWDNRQPVGHNIKVRLDRGFANAEFFNLFQSIRVWHIQTTESDHCCLLLDCRRGGSARSRRKRAFRYENMWRRDPSYKDMVEQAWGGSRDPGDMGQLAAHLDSMAGSMKDWEQSSFGSVRHDLTTLRKELEDERRASIHASPTRRERQLMSRLSELLTRHEIMEKLLELFQIHCKI
jgi:hypothetical protein